MKNIGIALFVIALLSFSLPGKRGIKVYLIGDSTMSEKDISAYPETGWGMPFSIFFDSTVTVNNRAKNGRSTKSFMEEGLWEPVVDQLQEGDYVFIQFGHNDEVPTKKTYTPPGEFSANLVKYVTDSKDKKAIPVLITPVARRKFDSTGRIIETHEQYTRLVRQVAQQYHIPLIDLDEKSLVMLQQLGPETSKYLFNYLAPAEHPNFPEGSTDDTHFNELGARKMAEIVLAEIKQLQLGLASRIVVHKPK